MLSTTQRDNLTSRITNEGGLPSRGQFVPLWTAILEAKTKAEFRTAVTIFEVTAFQVAESHLRTTDLAECMFRECFEDYRYTEDRETLRHLDFLRRSGAKPAAMVDVIVEAGWTLEPSDPEAGSALKPAFTINAEEALASVDCVRWDDSRRGTKTLDLETGRVDLHGELSFV